jgi:hypothetical protein
MNNETSNEMSDDLYKAAMQRIIDNNMEPDVRMISSFPYDFTADVFYLSQFDNGITLEAIINYPTFMMLIFAYERTKGNER